MRLPPRVLATVVGAFSAFLGKAALAAAVIVNVEPIEGPPGTVVTVAGSGFAPGASVKLNAVQVSIDSLSATQITFAVPEGATSG